MTNDGQRTYEEVLEERDLLAGRCQRQGVELQALRRLLERAPDERAAHLAELLTQTVAERDKAENLLRGTAAEMRARVEQEAAGHLADLLGVVAPDLADYPDDDVPGVLKDTLDGTLSTIIERWRSDRCRALNAEKAAARLKEEYDRSVQERVRLKHIADNAGQVIARGLDDARRLVDVERKKNATGVLWQGDAVELMREPEIEGYTGPVAVIPAPWVTEIEALQRQLADAGSSVDDWGDAPESGDPRKYGER